MGTHAHAWRISKGHKQQMVCGMLKFEGITYDRCASDGVSDVAICLAVARKARGGYAGGERHS